MGKGNQPKWVQLKRSAPIGLVWTVQDWWWNDVNDPENDGSTNVHNLLYDTNGNPAFAAIAVQHNGGDTPLRTDRNPAGQADAMFAMYVPGANFDPNKNQRGPFGVDVFGLGSMGSDYIDGIGLIESRHTQYWIIWKLVDQTGTPPPTPPPSGDYVTREQLRGVLIDTLIDVLEKGR